MILPTSFYAEDMVEVAQRLIGCFLVHDTDAGPASGRIVETEAYLVGDEAAHSFGGRTRRNRAVFGPVGHAYVFAVYGNRYCFNVVTGNRGGEAVLIRALEPVDGIALMQERRGTSNPLLLCSGPARLAQALGIGLACSTMRLTDGRLTILLPDSMPGYLPIPDDSIARTTRIGVTKSRDLPLRFFVRDNRYVSRQNRKMGQ